MSAYYIGCDVHPTYNGTYTRWHCTDGNGAVVYTESQVQNLYATPKMDYDDFLVLYEQAVIGFMVAYGVKLIRKSFGGNL